jgi:transcriptional regulator with XRE-family HTH domain
METVKKSNLTVRDLRERAGLTQRDVSIALDVRQSTVSDWERGIVEPRLPLSKVRILVALYKCTFDDLVDSFDVLKSKYEVDNFHSSKNQIVNISV